MTRLCFPTSPKPWPSQQPKRGAPWDKMSSRFLTSLPFHRKLYQVWPGGLRQMSFAVPPRSYLLFGAWAPIDRSSSRQFYNSDVLKEIHGGYPFSFHLFQWHCQQNWGRGHVCLLPCLPPHFHSRSLPTVPRPPHPAFSYPNQSIPHLTAYF